MHPNTYIIEVEEELWVYIWTVVDPKEQLAFRSLAWKELFKHSNLSEEGYYR